MEIGFRANNSEADPGEDKGVAIPLWEVFELV